MEPENDGWRVESGYCIIDDDSKHHYYEVTDGHMNFVTPDNSHAEWLCDLLNKNKEQS